MLSLTAMGLSRPTLGVIMDSTWVSKLKGWPLWEFWPEVTRSNVVVSPLVLHGDVGKGYSKQAAWNKELKNINLDHCLIHCINRTAPHLNKSEGAMKAIAHLLGCCKYQQNIPGGFMNTSITKSSEQCLEVSCWKLCSSQAKLQHFFH